MRLSGRTCGHAKMPDIPLATFASSFRSVRWDKMRSGRGATAPPAWAIMAGVGRKSLERQAKMSSNAIGLAGGTEASPRPRAGAQPGLSIVVPVYNEAAGLAALHGRISEEGPPLRGARGPMGEIVYGERGNR